MVKSVDLAIAVLLLIPLVALLYIPSYNRIEPMLFGISFFYWYQLAWMPLATILYYAAALLWESKEKDSKATKSSSRRRNKR